MGNITYKTNRFQIYNIDYQLRLIFRIFILLVLYSFARVGFYFFNISYFPDINFHRFVSIMIAGLRFDISAIIYINLPFIILYLFPIPFRYYLVYQRIIKWLFFLSNGLALALNTADFFYFEFILKRSTSDIFILAKEGHIINLLGIFILDSWRGVIFLIFLITIMAATYGRTRIRHPKPFKNLVFYLSSVTWLLISIYFSLVGIRGGFDFSRNHISISDAGKNTSKPLEMAIVLNTPFSIIQTLSKKPLNQVNYYQERELESIYDPVHLPQMDAEFKPVNVVVIIMQNLGKENIGTLNKGLDDGKYKGYTPFIDSLINQSKSYQWAFANGHTSIDALPAVVAGIPSIMQPYITSLYAANDINSIGSLLKTKGYETAFFYGVPNESLGFESFMKIAGYDKYYGMEEYGNIVDFDGSWGIWDEEFMLYMIDRMNQMKEPFQTTFFSVSTHHPFRIPKKYKNLFQEGTLNFHLSIQYADLALRQFFEKASGQRWFKNTLFVITADHASQPWHNDYKTAIGDFSIPLIFYHPGNKELVGIDSTIVQQLDILPTIMGYLNFDKKFLAYGSNILDPDAEHFAINYNNNTYQIIKGQFILQFLEEKTIGLYNFKSDPLLKQNLKDKLPEIKNDMEKLAKAFIQQYNNRMLKNELVPKNKF